MIQRCISEIPAPIPHVHDQAKLSTIGQTLDEAMEVVEKENKELKNVLPQVYGKANLDKTSLGELIDLISNTELKAESIRLCLRGRSILQLPIYNKAH
jgi:type I restriction-modification system DNA methylase subunit